MSYVVLARKYRPMRFADMVGQEHIARTLGNAITQGRVHHAYLFAGARGLGKTTTARIFAKGLVCEQGPTAEPCNECSECVAVSESRSVDVMEIDGASNNSVDNIRNLREQVHYLPQTARRKVYIIDEVHMLTTSAFNALLKTLEEPPAHVNFVFATTEPHKVLPTILSRVNRLDFKRVGPNQLVGFLGSILEREGLLVEDGGLRIVARAGGGSVRDALTLLDQVIAFAEDPTKVSESEVRQLLGQADATAVFDLVDAILERDPTTTMQRFDELVTGGNDLVVLSLQVLEHLRDLTVMRVCGTSQVLPDATEAELELLRSRGAKVDPAHLGQLFDRFSRVIDRLPQTRTPRLLVEMGLLDLACAQPVMPLGDLVDRLNALGGGGPPAGPGRGGSPRGGGPPRGAPPRGRGTPGGRGSSRSFSADASPPRAEAAPAAEPVRQDPAPPPRAERASAPAAEPARRDPVPPPDARPTVSARSAAPAAPEPPPWDDVPIDLSGPDLPDPGPSRAPRPAAAASRPSPAPERPNPAAPRPSPAPERSTAPRPAEARPTPVAAPASAPRPTAANGTRSSSSGSDPAPDSFAAKLFDMVRDSGAISEGPPPADRQPPAAPAGPPSPAASGPHVRPGRAAPAANGAPTGQAPGPSTRMGVGLCLPSEPADGLVEWEQLEPFEAWEQLVARIRAGDEFVAAVLGELGLVDLGGGVIKVAAPRGSFAHTELHRHPQLRAQLEQACRDHLGAPFAVELVEGEPVLPDLPSLVLVAQQRRKEHRAAVEAEARAHPGINALLRTFDGQLTGTKPLHEPS